jgi:SsrA-binding protein
VFSVFSVVSNEDEPARRRRAAGRQMAGKLIAENRRARFDYFLEQTFEAGLALTGSEVKSLRNGRANIAESYAAVEGDQIMLVNADIPPYAQANRFNHEPRRPRKLLLHRKEIERLIGAVQREGRTLVPTKLYWNDKGLAKLEIALAKGKKAHDKREAVAERDWQRDKARLMKDLG